jgi:riboflavin biosynthesis pyrimidine reductase
LGEVAAGGVDGHAGSGIQSDVTGIDEQVARIEQGLHIRLTEVAGCCPYAETDAAAGVRRDGTRRLGCRVAEDEYAAVGRGGAVVGVVARERERAEASLGKSTRGGGDRVANRGVSSAADRRAFLARRREADALLIGGNTARNEPYQKTPVPVVIVSKSMLNPLSNNRLAHWWNCDPVEALSRAQRLFGETIVIESGISIIEELIAAKKIDRLELSVTSVTGGEDQVDYQKLLKKFTNVTQRVEDETTFYTASN